MSSSTPCPFCGLGFKRLALHLPTCAERNGRDYSEYSACLAKRAVVSKPGRGVCSKCGRRFKRLDTHLRVSASCRTIAPRVPASSRPAPRVLASPRPASPMNNTYQTAVMPSLHASHDFKRPLKLPKTTAEWDEADSLLYAVTLSVQQAITAEEKNSTLCAGVYDVLASRFGTLLRPRKQMQSRPRQHDRALKKVTQLKNKARQALRRAKRQGESSPAVQSLAANFLTLLRDHSRLKRESSRRLHHKEAKVAREECHRDFWRYAKGLLDENSTSQTTPVFFCQHSTLLLFQCL